MPLGTVNETTAVENLTQRRDLHVQIVVLDHRVRPNRGNDLVPCDKIPPTPDQNTENIKRPRTDRYRGKDAVFGALKQAAGAPIEAKPFEQKDVVVVGHRPESLACARPLPRIARNLELFISGL